jgi:hypothetical protein
MGLWNLASSGWGYCGIEISSANDEYWLATDPSVAVANGRYFVHRRDTRASRMAYEEEERQRLWTLLEGITGAKY